MARRWRMPLPSLALTQRGQASQARVLVEAILFHEPEAIDVQKRHLLRGFQLQRRLIFPGQNAIFGKILRWAGQLIGRRHPLHPPIRENAQAGRHLVALVNDIL